MVAKDDVAAVHFLTGRLRLLVISCVTEENEECPHDFICVLFE